MENIEDRYNEFGFGYEFLKLRIKVGKKINVKIVF